MLFSLSRRAAPAANWHFAAEMLPLKQAEPQKDKVFRGVPVRWQLSQQAGEIIAGNTGWVARCLPVPDLQRGIWAASATWGGSKVLLGDLAVRSCGDGCRKGGEGGKQQAGELPLRWGFSPRGAPAGVNCEII